MNKKAVKNRDGFFTAFLLKLRNGCRERRVFPRLYQRKKSAQIR